MRRTHRRSGLRGQAIAWIAAYALVLNAVLFGLAAGASAAPDPLRGVMVLCATSNDAGSGGDHPLAGHVHCALCGLGAAGCGPAPAAANRPTLTTIDAPAPAAGAAAALRTTRGPAQPRAPPAG